MARVRGFVGRAVLGALIVALGTVLSTVRAADYQRGCASEAGSSECGSLVGERQPLVGIGVILLGGGVIAWTSIAWWRSRRR